MAERRYSLFQSFMQKIASTSTGAWLLSRTLHQSDWIFLKLSKGRMTLSSILTGVPVVVLTTTGARSGLPRTLPLLCIRATGNSDQLAVIASNWGQRHHPSWYFNLKAEPRATCSIGGKAGTYLAHEARGEEYEKIWQCAVETYLGYSLYKQRAGKRHIPIMVLTPEGLAS
jgi:deazaflavin-dependent oxidoreductase (nitroreductase family)